VIRTRFGLKGHARQTYLPGTDPATLFDAEGLAAPDPGALVGDPYVPLAAGTDTLYGGRVSATTTGFGTADARTVFDVTGAWNSVKNVSAASDTAAHLVFRGFVHVDASIGMDAAEGSVAEIVGAKRGNVVTGAGADRIDVSVVSNNAGLVQEMWSHEFRIASGAGNDHVTIGPLDLRLERRTGDVTFAPAPAHVGPVTGYPG
jgi:hypothetical protein